MAFVPTFVPGYAPRLVSGKYVPIFAMGAAAKINVAQLTLNIAFAALAGAVIAYLLPSLAGVAIAHKRVTIMCGIAMAAAVVAWGVYKIETVAAANRQSARRRAYSDERMATELLRTKYVAGFGQDQRDVNRWTANARIAAREKLLAAAENWRISGDRQAEERALSRAKRITEGLFDEIVLPGQTPISTGGFDPDAYLASEKAKDPFADFPDATPSRPLEVRRAILAASPAPSGTESRNRP